MSNFKRMKFKVKDAEHSKAIQEALFKEGYEWKSRTDMQRPRHLDMAHLYTYEDRVICYGNAASTFNEADHVEHFLVEGKIVDMGYWTQPTTGVTLTVNDSGYALSSAGIGAIKFSTEPAPLKTKAEHDKQRRLDILQAMVRYVEADKYIPTEWISEFSYLNNLMEK